jgi:N-acyl-D-aspartate/D-glutamate deacylase
MRLALSFLLLLAAAPDDDADLLIRGATIVDGSGKDGFAGDVAIKGERILAVGEWKGSAKTTVEGKGLIAAPGFIDLHNHSDTSILADDTRDNYNFTSQGCTTIVTGNCGLGTVDAGKLLRGVDEKGAGTNVIHLIPHGALRTLVFGSAQRPPTSEELAKMKELVDAGMKEGAWGLSTGLIYVPGTYARTDEIIELARIVHGYGGLYASHIRSEAAQLLESISEAIEIGEKSGCPVQISHLKCSTREAWGKMNEACARIEAARARGLKVTADQYPYAASSTRLSAYTVPSWALEGGKIAERLDDPEQGSKIRKAILESFERRDGPDKLVIALYKDMSFIGKSVDAIARAAGREPVDVVVEILKGGDAQTIGFSMREDDMMIGMRKDWVATASDGSAKHPTDERPHPRNYGTFPRKIGVYALEKKAFPLGFAIRSASGLPADILGLKDRGYLKAGYKADLVLFNPADFRDQATFEQPDQYSTGVLWVTVNGVPVIAQGRKTGALPGKALRRG